ncbi:uncharacterized protein [Procambarus clarkii]|uniref:uncharacterized protein isoform X1 n=1 Tax=Procambarus clarkii TaxID=6728 RepID=UPI0037430B91
MAALTPAEVVQEEDLNRLRYELAVTKAGRDALGSVFVWLYQGSYPINTHFTQTLGFTNADYKKAFNTHQRHSLDNSIDVTTVNTFDITLLYSLLQRVCGLADTNDPKWTTRGPSLEHLIHKLKQHRNTLAHKHVKMTEHELKTTLTELSDLLKEMLSVAGARGGRDSQEVDQVIKDVTEYIEGLPKKIRESLDPTDPTHLDQLHEEIKLFKAQIIEEVKQNSKQELTDGYRQLYQIEPAPWLLLNIKHDPSHTFTKLQLVQDSTIGVRPSHTPKVQDIEYEDLLTIRREDGRLPQCVLLTGEGGMGKTTLLKLILEKWVRDPLAIHHLDTVDLVFYVLCRDRHLNTIDDIINNLLPQTLLNSDVDFQMFKEIILSLNILVLIDGYDEVNENSEKLLKELLPLPGMNVKLVITTRPGWDQDLSLLIPSNKTRYNILVLGISPEHRLKYVNRIINALETDKSKQKATEDRFTQRLEKMSELLGDYLNTPLTLTLLALLCVETPEDFKKLTTSTEVYEQIHNFITEKLISRLKIKQVEDPEDKCDEFLLFFEEISLRGIVRKEFDLQPDTVKEIKLKCKALKLPHEEVLSNYFTRTSSRRGLKLVWVYGYFHSRYQEYCASKALLAQLLKADKERGGQPARSHYIDGWRKPNLLHDVMLEGEGKTHDGVISNHAKYQNVLINITGVMIARKLEHKFASQVIDMAKPEDEVLKHIVESHMNEHIIEAVVKELSDQKHWDIKNANSCDVLPLVLNKMTLKPRSLSIVINSKPQLSQISPLMSVLVKRKIILSLFLFYHHNENDEFSDVYLETLTAPGSECILKEFAGHLSEKAVPSLPDSIVSLYLRVTLQELPILLDHMPHLPNIKNFYIILDATGDIMDPATLARLPYSLLYLRLSVIRCLTDDSPDIDWCCDLARQLCPESSKGFYFEIDFADTHLTSVGVESLARSLHQKGITTDGLSVYTKDSLPQEDEDRLKELGDSLGLGLLSCLEAN